MSVIIINLTTALGVLIIPVGLTDKWTVLKWIMLCVVCDLKMLIIVRCVYNLKSATATSSLTIKLFCFFYRFDLFVVI